MKLADFKEPLAYMKQCVDKIELDIILYYGVAKKGLKSLKGPSTRKLSVLLSVSDMK